MFNIDRSFQNLLYQKFIFQKVYTIKLVAPELDVAPSTLYDYCSGKLNFPPDKITALYMATGDMDFIRFFTEATDLEVIKPLSTQVVGGSIAKQGLEIMEFAGKVGGEIKKSLDDDKLNDDEKSAIHGRIQPLLQTLLSLDASLLPKNYHKK